jgi:GPH family glycoside/pentoside/hexuronide:cation symporter
MTGLAEAIEGPSRNPLPVTDLGRFSLGMIGDRIFRDAPALLLLIFMTGYLGVPPAMAGTAVFVPKFLIMFVDPMVGTLSDRLQTRWGRRVPLMFIGALLSSASIVLFFHAPRLSTPALEATYMSCLIFVGFTGYSLYSVPYLTMASEIASGEEERRRIMSWRVMSMAVGLCFSAFAGALVQALGGGIAGYATMSWIYGGICLVTMMGTVTAAARLRSLASDGSGGEPAASLLVQVRGVAANRQYLRLLTVCFAQKLGEGVGYGSFAYFCIYVVEQPLSGIGLVVLASVAGQLVSQPAWLWASRRWSAQALYSVGVLGWCLNLVLWLAMRGHSSWWLIPLGLESGVAAGGFLMVTLAMLSDVLAADRARTGLNRDGIYSGVWSAMEKFAFAMGALVVGVSLGLFGFVESTNGAQTAQTPMAVFGIGFTYCGINMLIYLASIAAVYRVARQQPRLAAGLPRATTAA